MILPAPSRLVTLDPDDLNALGQSAADAGLHIDLQADGSIRIATHLAGRWLLNWSPASGAFRARDGRRGRLNDP